MWQTDRHTTCSVCMHAVLLSVVNAPLVALAIAQANGRSCVKHERGHPCLLVRSAAIKQLDAVAFKCWGWQRDSILHACRAVSAAGCRASQMRRLCWTSVRSWAPC